RSLDDSRARQVRKYVQDERPGTLPAAVVMNCRKPDGLSFTETEGGAGRLRIKSKLWLVDGQHRIAGLELAAEKDEEMRGYSVPVVILNGQTRESEMEHFFVINDRQKGVAVDLVLRYLVSGERNGRPRGRDDVLAIKVTDRLSLDRSSCWFRRIRLTNEPRLKTHTITELSFHRSLLPAVRVPSIRRSDPKQATAVITNYWNAIRDLIPDSFADPRRYLIQRTVGAYTMNIVFPHIFDLCLRKDSLSQPTFLEALLSTGIDSEDWTRQAAGAYAGAAGFSRLAEKYIQKLPNASLSVR
ncbi:MAG TPA: DGQHR domain-containing protein, partial [Candidatus Bathyarchaeia archaeon]|nr:DGQHR domain-containing protein [Candidatus Bathyarchaeia archaeon]